MLFKNCPSLPECQPIDGPESALQITLDCVDPEYGSPIVDGRADETTPVPHHKVSGYFDNTTVRFNFYFPLNDSSPENAWDGRFFQSAYPTQDDSASDRTIGNALNGNAYVVQVTGVHGYRAEAAAAKFSRTVASQYYGFSNSTDRRIFGYIYGASGGSLQVVGAIENTFGVWDGGIAMVQAITASVGISHSLRAMMGLVLQNKSEEIEAALRPGGNGDPYASLNQVQRAILHELVLLGAPIAVLEDFYAASNRTRLAQLISAFTGLDPTYVENFWTKDGYLGLEQSPLGDLFRAAFVDVNTTVLDVERDSEGVPIAVHLGKLTNAKAFELDWDGLGYNFTVFSNESMIGTLLGRFNSTTSVASFGGIESSNNNASSYPFITPNATLRLSNREWIAMHAWYRYQVPPLSEDRGYIGYDQFRTADGSSVYPQRPLIAAPILAASSAGNANLSGSIKAKLIVLQNLMDIDALPWWAHWYRLQVEQSLGGDFTDSYRLWYNDHAAHDEGPPLKADQNLLVDYTGIYEHSLRDLSDWVEQGVAPAPNSNYTLREDNSIKIPDVAVERGGIQPTVHVSISSDGSGSVRQDVVLIAVAVAPPGTGKIVAVEWDFYSTGDFVLKEVAEPAETVTMKMQFTYEEAGEYVVVVRATSQREGDGESLYGRASNLGRLYVSVA
ncbi:hypothetical protein BU25DRAFT_435723 [Macroventuria anomochaeta]|uniref:Uncharacterized protein n=1 Tax=Macroventuria anomochaeta TaxID=301207 RepID=A0ACB6RGQ5_9PLEO|nr:uncharacterized protein BU25DRAFT_435723 [Macroventuria anomochaeta]KAF2621076.1 hypothetical protein BU25DRAFT_435723 [Macroventuria anomochaeta]